MPNEPDPNNDQALRAYAEQRRAQAGAPGELHPVNRRLLQAEVARVHGGGGNAPAAPRAHWFARLWHRLATASVLIVAGVFAVRTIREDAAPQREIPALTLAETASEPAATTPPAPAAASEPTARAKSAPEELRDVPSEPQRLAIANDAQAPVRFRGARPVIEAKDAAIRVEATAGVPGPSRGLADAGAPTPTPMPAAKPASEAVAPIAAAPARYFKQQVVRSTGAPVDEARARLTEVAATAAGVADVKLGKSLAATALVLDRFTVEQSGRELRFLDADGSVYTGAVEVAIAETGAAGSPNTVAPAAPAPRANPARRQALSFAAVATNLPATTQWTFRAFGINRTLQQPVVVDGSVQGSLNSAATGTEILSRDNVSQTPPAGDARSRSQSADTQGKAGTLATEAYQQLHYYQRLNATRIQGKVRVGSNSPAQDLDALPETK